MDIDKAQEQARLAALDEIAERVKHDLFYLVKYVLSSNPDLITENTHRDLTEIVKPLLPNFTPDMEVNFTPKVRYNQGKVDDILSDQFDINRKQVLILMPRGTFKSSIITIGFTLQYLLNDPNARILIDSETYGKAKNFLAEIKGHLEGNEKFRTIYHHIYGVYPDSDRKNPSTRWTDAQVDLAARTTRKKEPSIMCSGVDRSINGMHFDLIIEDDLHSEKNVTNKDQIEQVIAHRRLALSLLDPGMPRITIGTRWDFMDAYSDILKNKRKSYNILLRKAKEDDGSYLFPERLTEQFLDEQRREQGSYIFSCQYMNNPVDDETATFKHSYFKYVNWSDIEEKPISWFVATDPSNAGPFSDFAGYALVGMDSERNLYIRKAQHFKQKYSEIITAQFDWYQRYTPRRMALETVATQSQLEYMLIDEQKRRGVWLPLEIIKNRTATKEDRILALAPYYEFGRVFHVKDDEDFDDYEYELTHFPKGENDDIIDAVSTALQIATPPSGRATARRRAKENSERTHDKPRSIVTGI